MNTRERFNCVMNFEKPDRLFFCEFLGFWPETKDRWYEEGLPKDVSTDDYFGFDKIGMVLINFNFIPPFEVKVLEEDAKTKIVIDETGTTKKLFKYGSAMPHYIDFPIKIREDYLQIKERLNPDDPTRYPANWKTLVSEYKNRDYPLGVLCRGLLAFGRDFMKFEDLMIAFMDQPKWMDEMMEFHTNFLIRLWDRVLTDVDIDFILLGEDMAYKTGPMVSPRVVKEMMVPRYKKLVEFFKRRGVQHIIIDSDGDIRQLIPLFIEAGITGVLPMENNAGCNPIGIRNGYPRLQMIGGMDKQKVALGGKVMENEVCSKIGKLGPAGGYIPSFDHSVHPDVSLETYKHYLNLLR